MASIKPLSGHDKRAALKCAGSLDAAETARLAIGRLGRQRAIRGRAFHISRPSWPDDRAHSCSASPESRGSTRCQASSNSARGCIEGSGQALLMLSGFQAPMKSAGPVPWIAVSRCAGAARNSADLNAVVKDVPAVVAFGGFVAGEEGMPIIIGAFAGTQ
jgi:hypothetical protein